ncbi:deoxycytidine kinase [Chlorella sorokiniana]|uniref:Deoxycytidine kinase n=1 Tax=Chlorella sorokiniana TaxID=3076 RepID=A0A2P6TLX6_CHLSO|nr:deoxycytidine kinase [Chlorella sorokiniana]|eukprot:PRW45341.1 deoxycytidine kinase [Chlorella sorokiniana]
MQQAPGTAGLSPQAKLAAGAAALGLAYWMYSRSQAKNLGDAASRAGAATGRAIETAGQKTGSETLKEEGRGLQAKQHSPPAASGASTSRRRRSEEWPAAMRRAAARLGPVCLEALYPRSSFSASAATVTAAEGMAPAAAAAGACRALAHATCSTSGGPAPGAGSHRAAPAQPRRSRPRESRRLSTAAAPAGRGGSRGAGRGGSGAGGSSSDDDLQQLRGLGPVGEAKLRQKFITTLPDLFKLYHRECGGDAVALAKFLIEGVGIKKQFASTIAGALLDLAEARPELLGEGGISGDGSGGGDERMVTLAVEGNISAGKSTFLNVLSHRDTCLHDILKVVQEPVQQWQEYRCRDIRGNEKTENVLEKFYSDPDRYAYSFQHYVLLSRVQEDIKTRASEGKHLRVLERSIFSDRQVFVRAMHREGKMADFEVSVYNQIELTAWLADFEVSVYNQIFDDHLNNDLQLIPDGFVYLRARPDVCWQRMQRRSRSEESMIPLGYLEMLHANHEDWLHEQSVSADELARHPMLHAEVLKPASDEYVQQVLRSNPAVQAEVLPNPDWRLHTVRGVPDAIRGQVLLLSGPPELPQLKNRLALVMDHDQDVDIDNDADARAEYSEKIRAFYDFVREWKQQEAEEQRLQRLVAAQAGLPMLALGQAGSERRQVASL